MLPDLRVLVFATVSTFVITVGAGLFASVRLLPEPMSVQPDRETPSSRVATTWQDVNRAPLREFTKASLRQEPAELPVEQPQTPSIKIEDRPAGVPALPASSGAPSATDENIAVKSEPAPEGALAARDKDTTTANTGGEKRKLAARPDAPDATREAPAPAIAAAPTEIKAQRKVERKHARKQRAVRRDIPSTGPGSDGGFNYLTEFGSRSH